MVIFPRTIALASLACFACIQNIGVEDFPGGAGACLAGTSSAVGGPHAAVASIGDLSVGDLVLTINGRTVPEGSEINLRLNKEYEIGVVWMGGSGAPFRGVLMRGQDVNGGSGVLLLDPDDDPNLHPAMACNSQAPAIGITHNNNLDKMSVAGSIQYMGGEDALGVTMDVTVVVQRVIHYYSGYTFNFLKPSGKKGASLLGGKKGGMSMDMDEDDGPIGGKKRQN